VILRGYSTAEVGTFSGITDSSGGVISVTGGVIGPDGSTAIRLAAVKATPVDADEFGFLDSAAEFGVKKFTWANLKSAVAAYYNTLTATLTNKTLTSPTLTSPNIDGGAGSANIATTSSATDANLNLYAKGAGAVVLRNTIGPAFSAHPVASGVNYFQAYSQVAGAGPSLYAVGADTNINLNLVPKGTGVVQANGTSVELTSRKAMANGYASLDSAGKVPVTQLPSSIMQYQGVWNASTNTPTLVNGTGDTGDVYRVSVAGTALSLTFGVGDYVIYNGSTWERSDSTDAVASVAGKTGAVTLNSGDVGLDNVDNTSDATKNAAAVALVNKTSVTSTGAVTGSTLVSTVATGTAPLTVASATVVPNLNASTVNAYGPSVSVAANTLAARDGSGNVNANAFNSTVATGTAPLTVASTTVVNNLNANYLDNMLRSPSATVNTVASRDASANLTANAFVSTVATGVAPLTVASTTMVTNLNANLLNGLGQTISPNASSIAARDANGNLSADNFINAVESTVTAVGIKTLTMADAGVQVFTGSTTHTVVLPSGASVLAGVQFTIINQSTGSIAVQYPAGTTVLTVPAAFTGEYTALTTNPTLSTHWRGVITQNTSGQLPYATNTLAAFAQSTTNTIGVGNIELGHASDTTLSRSAAGVVAVEGVPLANTTGAQTLTDKRIKPRIVSVVSAATPTIDVVLYDQCNITALAVATTVGVSGTAFDGQKLLVRIKDNGTARAVTWSASFVSSGSASLLATTVANKTHLIGFIYDEVAAKWVCVASDIAGY
jgi:hypothetical protein